MFNKCSKNIDNFPSVCLFSIEGLLLLLLCWFYAYLEKCRLRNISFGLKINEPIAQVICCGEWAASVLNFVCELCSYMWFWFGTFMNILVTHKIFILFHKIARKRNQTNVNKQINEKRDSARESGWHRRASEWNQFLDGRQVNNFILNGVGPFVSLLLCFCFIVRM